MIKVRNGQIEALRVVGCFMIMVYHFTYKYSEVNLTENQFGLLHNMGQYGVALFITISGLYILPKSHNYIFQELFSRYFKLWLPYVISIYYIVCVTFRWYTEYNVVQIITNTFFVNSFIGISYIDGAHWYITYLLIFLLWSHMISYLGLHNYRWTYYAWGSIAVLSNFLADIDFSIIWLNLVFGVMRLITGGAYTYILIPGIMITSIVDKRNNVVVSNKIVQECNFIKEIGLIIFCDIFIGIHFGIDTMIFTIVAQIITFNAYERKMKVFNSSVFVVFGGTTYYVYLVHQQIGYMIMSMYNGQGNSYKWGGFILAILLACFNGLFVKQISKMIKTNLRKCSDKLHMIHRSK